MKLYIKEINRTKTIFGEYNITYYLLNENYSVLKSCVSSSPEWAEHDLLHGHDEWKDAEVKFL